VDRNTVAIGASFLCNRNNQLLAVFRQRAQLWYRTSVPQIDFYRKRMPYTGFPPSSERQQFPPAIADLSERAIMAQTTTRLCPSLRQSGSVVRSVSRSVLSPSGAHSASSNAFRPLRMIGPIPAFWLGFSMADGRHMGMKVVHTRATCVEGRTFWRIVSHAYQRSTRSTKFRMPR
jgi:hypothetical protein